MADEHINRLIICDVQQLSDQLSTKCQPGVVIMDTNEFIRLKSPIVFRDIAILKHSTVSHIESYMKTYSYNLNWFIEKLREHCDGGVYVYACDIGKSALFMQYIVEMDTRLQFTDGLYFSNDITGSAEGGTNINWLLDVHVKGGNITGVSATEENLLHINKFVTSVSELTVEFGGDAFENCDAGMYAEMLRGIEHGLKRWGRRDLCSYLASTVNYVNEDFHNGINKEIKGIGKEMDVATYETNAMSIAQESIDLFGKSYIRLMGVDIKNTGNITLTNKIWDIVTNYTSWDDDEERTLYLAQSNTTPLSSALAIYAHGFDISRLTSLITVTQTGSWTEYDKTGEYTTWTEADLYQKRWGDFYVWKKSGKHPNCSRANCIAKIRIYQKRYFENHRFENHNLTWSQNGIAILYLYNDDETDPELSLLDIPKKLRSDINPYVKICSNFIVGVRRIRKFIEDEYPTAWTDGRPKLNDETDTDFFNRNMKFYYDGQSFVDNYCQAIDEPSSSILYSKFILAMYICRNCMNVNNYVSADNYVSATTINGRVPIILSGQSSDFTAEVIESAKDDSNNVSDKRLIMFKTYIEEELRSASETISEIYTGVDGIATGTYRVGDEIGYQVFKEFSDGDAWTRGTGTRYTDRNKITYATWDNNRPMIPYADYEKYAELYSNRKQYAYMGCVASGDVYDTIITKYADAKFVLMQVQVDTADFSKDEFAFDIELYNLRMNKYTSSGNKNVNGISDKPLTGKSEFKSGIRHISFTGAYGAVSSNKNHDIKVKMVNCTSNSEVRLISKIMDHVLYTTGGSTLTSGLVSDINLLVHEVKNKIIINKLQKMLIDPSIVDNILFTDRCTNIYNATISKVDVSGFAANNKLINFTYTGFDDQPFQAYGLDAWESLLLLDEKGMNSICAVSRKGTGTSIQMRYHNMVETYETIGDFIDRERDFVKDNSGAKKSIGLYDHNMVRYDVANNDTIVTVGEASINSGENGLFNICRNIHGCIENIISQESDRLLLVNDTPNDLYKAVTAIDLTPRHLHGAFSLTPSSNIAYINWDCNRVYKDHKWTVDVSGSTIVLGPADDPATRWVFTALKDWSDDTALDINDDDDIITAVTNLINTYNDDDGVADADKVNVDYDFIAQGLDSGKYLHHVNTLSASYNTAIDEYSDDNKQDVLDAFNLLCDGGIFVYDDDGGYVTIDGNIYKKNLTYSDAVSLYNDASDEALIKKCKLKLDEFLRSPVKWEMYRAIPDTNTTSDYSNHFDINSEIQHISHGNPMIILAAKSESETAYEQSYTYAHDVIIDMDGDKYVLQYNDISCNESTGLTGKYIYPRLDYTGFSSALGTDNHFTCKLKSTTADINELITRYNSSSQKLTNYYWGEAYEIPFTLRKIENISAYEKFDSDYTPRTSQKWDLNLDVYHPCIASMNIILDFTLEKQKTQSTVEYLLHRMIISDFSSDSNSSNSGATTDIDTFPTMTHLGRCASSSQFVAFMHFNDETYTTITESFDTTNTDDKLMFVSNMNKIKSRIRDRSINRGKIHSLDYTIDSQRKALADYEIDGTAGTIRGVVSSGDDWNAGRDFLDNWLEVCLDESVISDITTIGEEDVTDAEMAIYNALRSDSTNAADDAVDGAKKAQSAGRKSIKSMKTMKMLKKLTFLKRLKNLSKVKGVVNATQVTYEFIRGLKSLTGEKTGTSLFGNTFTDWDIFGDSPIKNNAFSISLKTNAQKMFNSIGGNWVMSSWKRALPTVRKAIKYFTWFGFLTDAIQIGESFVLLAAYSALKGDLEYKRRTILEVRKLSFTMHDAYILKRKQTDDNVFKIDTYCPSFINVCPKVTKTRESEENRTLRELYDEINDYIQGGIDKIAELKKQAKRKRVIAALGIALFIILTVATAGVAAYGVPAVVGVVGVTTGSAATLGGSALAASLVAKLVLVVTVMDVAVMLVGITDVLSANVSWVPYFSEKAATKNFDSRSALNFTMPVYGNFIANLSEKDDLSEVEIIEYIDAEAQKSRDIDAKQQKSQDIVEKLCVCN